MSVQWEMVNTISRGDFCSAKLQRVAPFIRSMQSRKTVIINTDGTLYLVNILYNNKMDNNFLHNVFKSHSVITVMFLQIGHLLLKPFSSCLITVLLTITGNLVDVWTAEKLVVKMYTWCNKITGIDNLLVFDCLDQSNLSSNITPTSITNHRACHLVCFVTEYIILIYIIYCILYIIYT